MSKNLFDLVSMEARVVTEVSENSQDEYVLQADGYIFSAIFHRAFGEDPQARPLKKIPLGSLVRVSGVCILESSDPYTGAVPFNLLMRSFDDIVVVEEPSLLNVRNLILLVGLLLVLMTVGGVRGWSLERKVRRHAAASAESERQRSHILEGITGSQPLGEIISDIAGMVSSMLHGAPCWCEIGGDAIHGNRPPELQQLRVVQTEINARTGPGLGTLFAGLDTWTKPLPGETLALHNGARLVTLAIETRRLYADLRRRSEFDLLTDVPNRFALEKFMEAKIEWARSAGVTLGLIYIDLDKFKPVNDTYGHHVGDLYLQEVALRMNKQLLGGDMLARLGGDEFAALVTLQHCHPDLDRIVGRLQACFDEPFVVAGATIHGSASIGIALFPEDGQDREELLKVADTAMYAVKNSKQALQV